MTTTSEQPTFKVIVARYNENIDWLKSILNYCVIYNKGRKLNIQNEIMLDNIGRESHTYLHHIIQNYDQLEDVLVFTQANISDHCNCGNDVSYLMQMKDDAYKYGKSRYYMHLNTGNNTSCWDPHWNFNRNV
jgi:hypothetical protein